MAHVGQPVLPPYTILNQWGWYCTFTQIHLYQMSQNCKDKWLIGHALYEGFRQLALIFDTIGSFCWNLDLDIRNKWAWIIGITEQYTFRDLLDYFSYWYQLIREDPVWFVKYMFSSISWDFWDFVYITSYWFRGHLTGIVGWIDYWLTDPVNWIIDNLVFVAYWIRSFLDNPSPWILIWVNALFPFLSDIVNNALVWLVNIIHSYTGWFWDFIINPFGFIVAKVRLLGYEISHFIDNPSWWLFEYLMYFFRLTPPEIWDLPMAIFKKSMRQIQIRRGEVETLIDSVVCDVICWFI